MTLETSLANIVMRNNTIDQGRFSTGSSPVTYTYDSHSWIYGASIIEGNTFIAPTADADILNIDNCSCTIEKNKFIRGATSINSYIRNYGSNDQIITNNIFDNETLDGSDDVLVLGLSADSIYHSNKNQIIYIPISMAGGTFTSDTTNTDVVSDSSMSVTTQWNYLSVFINTLTARTFYINFDLNSALPEGVRVLEAKIGIYNTFIGSAALTSGSFTLAFVVQDVLPANYSTGVNSLLDVKNRNSVVLDQVSDSIDLLTNFATVQAQTMYATVDIVNLGTPDYWLNTRDKCMTAQVFITNDLSVLGSGMQWNISPIIVKCRW